MSELRKKIHDDNNGLDYVLVGDYYLPVLSLPEETRPIGCWGMLRKEYLKEQLGDTQIGLIRRIKKAFDPNLILNPDKVV